jgi:Response regulator containing a CheY-like receiver domain and an HTH DNA-binding domain
MGIRILLIDDHRVIRKGLRALLNDYPDFEVVGEAGSRAEAIALVESERPNLVLLDLDLGSTTSLDFLSELLAIGRGMQVLVLTGVRDKELQRQAIQLGAMGIVLKDHAAEVLIEAIQKVNSGEMWLDRSTIVSMLGNTRRANADPERVKISMLTEREREIISLLAEGLRNKQIGERLFISEITVRHHLTSIFNKLAVSDRVELLIYAYRNGIVATPMRP